MLQSHINKVFKDIRFKKSDTFWKRIIEIGNPEYFKMRAIEAVEANDYLLAIRLLILILANKECNTSHQSKRKGTGRKQ